MGVHIGHAEGEYVTLLRCKNCSIKYETDERMNNLCPDCGRARWEDVTPEGAAYTPSEWR